MNSSVITQNDDNIEQEISLTPPPLPDKHVPIDMFSSNEQIHPNNENNIEKLPTTPTTPTTPLINDDPVQDMQCHTPKKLEPVLGKERAIKILKAFGSQQKPVKELHHNVLKTPSKDSKPRKEKKLLTPMQKAKETISEIEELKKIKDRMIPTYFGENVVIHHIKVTHSLNEAITRLDSNGSKSYNVDKVISEPVAKKSTVDSLEALKVYNNLDADKQSDDELISDREENILSEAQREELVEPTKKKKKKKLPIAFDLEAKHAKQKRRKRLSSDSRSNEKKRKRRNKDRKKKKSRESSSRRSSTKTGEKRSKRKRDSTHDNETSTCKVVRSESRSIEYSFERYTKTLPIITYSPNPKYNLQPLTNGLITKESTTKKKKRSTSKTKVDKEKRKKSSSIEKAKEKVRRRRSGSKIDGIKSIKRQRIDLEKSELNLNSKTKTSNEIVIDLADEIANEIPDKTTAKINVDEKSPNSEEYMSNWDNWDDMEDVTGSSIENLIVLDTIPLQLNVPKQDRSTLYTNDCKIKASDEFSELMTPRLIKTTDEFNEITPRIIKSSEEFNEITPRIIKASDEFNQMTTPRMFGTESAVETPIFSEVKDASDSSEIDDNDRTIFKRMLKDYNTKDSYDNDLEKSISKITASEPTGKNLKKDEVKSNHQPIAQLYDEYEQFIMSCMPVSDECRNGGKASIDSSLLDEIITSNDGEEELEALKKSLQKKLHEMEHNDSEDALVKEVGQPTQKLEPIGPKPIVAARNESSDSSSSSTSSSSSDSSSSSSASSTSRKKQLKKKNRKRKKKSKVMSSIEDNIFNLKAGIEDDDISDNELLSKVEHLKQQMSEKRKALANKRKLAATDFESPETSRKADMSDALLSPEKRSAISLKIGNSKSNSMKAKPITFDDDDFTDKLLLEVTSTPNTVARAKETNKLLIERVIEPEVGIVSSSNSNSLASEIINTKVTRIGMLPNTPNVSDIFVRTGKLLPLENAILKIDTNKSLPVDTSEMKNYLNNATLSHYDSSDSITSKTSVSVDSSNLSNSIPAVIHKISPIKHQTPPPRSDKRDSSDLNSKTRSSSPHQRSRTKDISSKRHYSPPPSRHRSPRFRKRSSHRSPSPIRKRSRGSPRRSRSPRKSPRRHSPRRLRKSLSPRSKRPLSPIRGRPRTPPLPDKHINRKWEPPHVEFTKNSTKSGLDCENNVPQPICRLESNSTSWSGEENSAFAQYDYHHVHALSPKRSSLDERIAHSFNQSDQSYDFHQASGAYMNHFEYSAENTSKIPVLNSQENYYFQQQHIPPHGMPTQSTQPPQHMPRQHVPSQNVRHMVPNQPLPSQQRLFSNLIEIRQSNIITEAEPSPFVVKGNVLEIVPSTESIVVKPRTDSTSTKLYDSNCDVKVEIKEELTEDEMKLREVKKAEIKLKRKQERDKRQLERFMRKEKLRLEIKHLMEVSVPIPDVKKATYNPNAIGGKSILRLTAPSSNKKSVLFADGVAPGDGTSTSGGEDVAPLLRDRNKRMTKRKLDSKRRRARREASIIKKEVVPQTSEITPFIDPELENMPPPLPPDGNPTVRLPQPKLKSTPKLIYFHYDPLSNAMYVSPYPTPVHIPQKPSEKTFSALTNLPTDSPTASSTPDQIQRPKVCFIQPPVFEQRSTQDTGSVLAPLPNLNQQHSPTVANSVSSKDVPTPLPPIKLFNQQPASNPLPSPAVLYPSRHPQSISPLNYRMPMHPAGQQQMQIQSTPMQMQPSPMASQWDNSGYQTNTPNPPSQQQPCPQIWESDVFFPSTPIRPLVRFGNSNNLPQQRPPHNPWDQQRHPTPLFQNTVHQPQSSFPNIQSHPGPNHQMFHQNQSINVNSPHQPHQQNNFAFNANHSMHYNTHPNQWNHQYRNNH